MERRERREGYQKTAAAANLRAGSMRGRLPASGARGILFAHMTIMELIRHFVTFLAGMLTSLSSSLPDPAWMKVLVIALLTWGWEEPISVGSALMVAAGDLPFWLVFAALAIGFPTGDCMLYLLGRCGKQFVEHTRWYQRSDAVRQSSLWFDRNVIGAVFLARFTPGLRFPTYVAAGMLHVRFLRFLPGAILAGLAETTVLLLLATLFGETVLDQFQEHKKLIGGALFTLFLVVMLVSLVRRIHKARKAASPARSAT